MGLRIRLLPGLSLGVSSRGLRASVAPRAARIHVGTGRTGFSSGLGPVSVGTAFGGGRARGGGYARDMRAAGAATRRAEKHREWDALRQQWLKLLDVREQTFSPARPPDPLPSAQPMTLSEARKLLLDENSDILSGLPLRERRRARRLCGELADERARAETGLAAAEVAFQDGARQAAWAAFLNNDAEQSR